MGIIIEKVSLYLFWPRETIEANGKDKEMEMKASRFSDKEVFEWKRLFLNIVDNGINHICKNHQRWFLVFNDTAKPAKDRLIHKP